MSWTTPRTWVSGELVTHTIMNAHIRDNLDILKLAVNDDGTLSPFQFGRMTSNVTKNASTTFGDLTGLSFDVLASEIWCFLGLLHGISPAAADYKFTATGPTGITGRFGCTGGDLGAVGASNSSATYGNAVVATANGTNDETILMYGTAVISATAGTVQLQFAQNSSTGSDSIIYANSSLIAVKIA